MPFVGPFVPAGPGHLHSVERHTRICYIILIYMYSAIVLTWAMRKLQIGRLFALIKGKIYHGPAFQLFTCTC